MASSLPQYQTREVRDLAWACFSEPLLISRQAFTASADVANCGLQLSPQRLAWLQQLDHDPGPLLAHLAAAHSTRLGLYFEQLWHFFLQQDPQIDLLAHNLPVRDGGRTIGEFDCLYFCRQRQRPVHLELAVKFYLGYCGAGASEHPQWLGPSSADRLDIKIAHLFQRQIRLGDEPRGAQALHTLGIESADKEVELKGYLFQPVTASLPLPDGFNPKRELQHWVHMEQLHSLLAQLPCYRYRPLPRAEWLAPAFVATTGEAMDAGELSRQLSSPARPQLIAGLDRDGREQLRFFVTGNDWPQC